MAGDRQVRDGVDVVGDAPFVGADAERVEVLVGMVTHMRSRLRSHSSVSSTRSAGTIIVRRATMRVGSVGYGRNDNAST